MKSLTISQLAKATQVNVETVRYYERRRLIPEPPRRESGYRQYAPDVIDRIQFIKRAQQLGFSLEEIAELLALRVDPQGNAEEVKKRAEVKIAQVEQKIMHLQQMKRALVELAGTCSGQGSTSDCPILAGLACEDGADVSPSVTGGTHG